MLGKLLKRKLEGFPSENPLKFHLECERHSVYELQIHFSFSFLQVLQNMNLSLKSEVQKLQALTNEQVKQLV